MILGECGKLQVAGGFGERLLILVVVDVTDTLEEQERGGRSPLEIRLVDGAAQDVGRLPQMGLQLLKSQHRPRDTGIDCRVTVSHQLCPRLAPAST